MIDRLIHGYTAEEVVQEVLVQIHSLWLDNPPYVCNHQRSFRNKHAFIHIVLKRTVWDS